MKKILSLALALTVLLFAFSSCAEPSKGDLMLEADATHDEVVARMVTGAADVVILPEPKATAAINQAKTQGHNYSIKLNLSEEWDKISSNGLAMGCVVVRNEFIADYEADLVTFLDAYKSSIAFIGNADNKDTAAQMIVDAGIIPKLPIAKSALNNLYGAIVYEEGSEMKVTLEAFYDAIELTKPAEEFYYSRTTAANEEASRTVKIGVMNGPTGMGMAKLIHDSKNNTAYEFISYSDPQVATTDLISGEIDMACLPTNAAANLANKGQPISVGAINCLGSLYVIAKDEINIESVDDLIDKTVYYGVPTSTTEPIFSYILDKNNIKIVSSEDEE